MNRRRAASRERVMRNRSLLEHSLAWSKLGERVIAKRRVIAPAASITIIISIPVFYKLDVEVAIGRICFISRLIEASWFSIASTLSVLHLWRSNSLLIQDIVSFLLEGLGIAREARIA